MKSESPKMVEIPASLFERVEARIKGSGFKSVSDYVTHVIRESLAAEGVEQPPSYTKEEEEKVKERLRALGYL